MVAKTDLGYTASMFHLFTHALFKALLFLGAGAVIHFMHSNEMKDMGGLRKYLPVTHITFLIACLAIAGIPPFAGFFSKEEILLAAYQHNKIIYWIALITSGSLLFICSVYILLFSGIRTCMHMHEIHHGEGGFAMKLPLVLLAMVLLLQDLFLLEILLAQMENRLKQHFICSFLLLPVVLALTGIFTAMWLYKKQNNRPDKIAASLGGLYKAAYHKFYIDEMYLFITKKIIFNLIGRPAAWFDKNIVDGLMNATGNTTADISEIIKGVQSGKVQQYAIVFFMRVVLGWQYCLFIWKCVK